MFSGIVEEMGTVEAILHPTGLTALFVRARKVVGQAKPGDSICVSGVCLTVTGIHRHVLAFDVVQETLNKTTLGRLKSGAKVNLERALKVNGRVNGHFVTGHIDGVGQIKKKIWGKNYTQLHVCLSKRLLPYIVPKGSVCLDGVSLTVGRVGRDHFVIHLIPFTKKVTTLESKKEGDWVNIETDILAKYILNRAKG